MVTDPQVIGGLAEGSIEVDFSKLMERDKKGETKFEVAGRVYWESNVKAPNYLSYTTNGFFDKEGYEEPQLPSQQLENMLKWIIPVGLVVIIITIYCCVKRCDRIKEE